MTTAFFAIVLLGIAYQLGKLAGQRETAKFFESLRERDSR
jgi:hypothetical protein